MNEPVDTSPFSTHASRRERWLVAIACLAVAGAHLSVAAALGALGVSRNDDWTYYRVAFASYTDGGFSPDPYTRAMLIGLVGIARPVMAVFGPEMAPLQITMALVGAFGLWGTWLVVRSFLPPLRAALAVATLALGPIYGSLSTTFMTDVPAFALQTLALACAAVALRGRTLHWGWMLASLTLCFAAFSVREYAVVALLAVAASGLARSGVKGRDRAILLGVSLAWLVGAAALYVWRGRVVSGAGPVTLRLIPDVEQVRGVARTAYTLSLFVSPAIVVSLVTGGWSLLRRRRWFFFGSIVVVLSGVVMTGGDFLLGNYVTRFGSYPETVSGAPPVVVHPVLWGVVLTVSAASTAVVLTWLWSGVVSLRHSATRRAAVAALRGGDAAVALASAFLVATLAAVIVLSLATGERIFDRYLLPAVPYASALLMFAFPSEGTTDETRVPVPAPRWWHVTVQRWSAVLMSGLLAVLATGLVIGSAALDGAKWKLGEATVARGLSAETIDAGLEWFGMHQSSKVVRHPFTSGPYSFWVTGLFEKPRVCAVAMYTSTGPDALSTDRTADPAGPALVSTVVWTPLASPFVITVRPADLRC